MSVGLFGLLDDVAAIARLAAASIDDIGAASAKATSKTVVLAVDDAAVTPQFVHGVTADRELPIVKQIAKGSIRNKLLLILPAAMLLSQFLPDLLPILLICGGTYLAFEGAEKVWERISHHDDAGSHATPVALQDAPKEKSLISGAIRTDLILSAEIMVIALNEVADESVWMRLGVLVVVAILMTVGVYGAVGLIVKMDDIGLAIAERRKGKLASLGRMLVRGMPKLLAVLTVVGTAAMLWVGGHILLVNVAELGWWEAPYDLVHHVEEEVHHAVAGFGGFLAWAVNTLASALVGLAVGAVVVLVVHLIPRKKVAHG